MGNTTETVNSPVASPSEASSSSEKRASTISVKQPDLEVQSPPQYPERRTRRSKPSFPTRIILGVFFILLLLGMIGAGGYHYYSNKTATKVPSVLKTSSVKSGSRALSRTAGSTLSGSSGPDLVVSSPLEGAQSVLSKHPRSLAATIFAVIVTIALIVTVVMLVKSLNTPPQIIEKLVPADGPPAATPGSAGGGMSSLAIGLTVAAAVLAITTVVGFGLAYKFRSTEAPVDDTTLYMSDDNTQIQAGIKRVFEHMCRLVKLDDSNWNAVNGQGAPNNMWVVNMDNYANYADNQATHYMKVTNGGTKTSTRYFAYLISLRESLPFANGTHEFVLFVLNNENELLSVYAPVPHDAKFIVVRLEPFSGNTETLKTIMRQLMFYKSNSEEWVVSSGGVPLPLFVTLGNSTSSSHSD